MKRDISQYNFEKGDIGERLVRSALKKRGWMLAAFDEGEAHPCDNFASKWDMKFRALDIKTYPRRSRFPDTGINLDHYEKYMQAPNDFYLLFVDQLEKKVYGNQLKELNKPTVVNAITYPLFDGSGDKRKVYFPLQNMELYAPLPDDICEELKKLSNSGYKGETLWFEIDWKKNVSWT